MRALAHAPLLVCLALGCTTTAGLFPDGERQAVAKAVDAAMRDALARLDTLDGPGLDTVFLNHPDVLNVEDTVITQGYTALNGYFSAALQAARGIDSTRFESLQVFPLAPNAAVAVARFHEIIVLQDGTRIRDRGVWSATFLKQAGTWKMVTAHVSHAPGPPAILD